MASDSHREMQEQLASVIETFRSGLKAVAVKTVGPGDDGTAHAHYREHYDGERKKRKPVFPSGKGPSDSEEQWLLAFILAAHLDPEIARLMDLAVGESCQGGTGIGILEALEAESLEERFSLRARFAPTGALVKEGWCQVEYSVLGTLLIHPTPQGIALVFGEPAPVEDAQEETGNPPSLRNLGDLIVSPDVAAEIGELVQAARGREIALNDWGIGAQFSRGLALSALFDGEPGTGKTLCAEVLAGELNRPLQRVNVARLLDKYVGGTQKNIEAAFEEASRTGSVLLFDEADALFARRVQVESSQDRHANLEINPVGMDGAIRWCRGVDDQFASGNGPNI